MDDKKAWELARSITLHDMNLDNQIKVLLEFLVDLSLDNICIEFKTSTYGKPVPDQTPYKCPKCCKNFAYKYPTSNIL